MSKSKEEILEDQLSAAMGLLDFVKEYLQWDTKGHVEKEGYSKCRGCETLDHVNTMMAVIKRNEPDG